MFWGNSYIYDPFLLVLFVYHCKEVYYLLESFFFSLIYKELIVLEIRNVINNQMCRLSCGFCIQTEGIYHIYKHKNYS